jgi:hypothetical protein
VRGDGKEEDGQCALPLIQWQSSIRWFLQSIKRSTSYSSGFIRQWVGIYLKFVSAEHALRVFNLALASRTKPYSVLVIPDSFNFVVGK